jgi:hypothetical protein
MKGGWVTSEMCQVVVGLKRVDVTELSRSVVVEKKNERDRVRRERVLVVKGREKRVPRPAGVLSIYTALVG